MGCFAVIAASVWLGLAPQSMEGLVLIPSMLAGSGSTMMSVQALTLMADLIGAHAVSNLLLSSFGERALSIVQIVQLLWTLPIVKKPILKSQ